jgi:hypothetical protein
MCRENLELVRRATDAYNRADRIELLGDPVEVEDGVLVVGAAGLRE